MKSKVKRLIIRIKSLSLLFKFITIKKRNYFNIIVNDSKS